MPDGLHGLGDLEAAARASYMEPDELPPSVQGRNGISREVFPECADPMTDTTVRAWVEQVLSEEPPAGDWFLDGVSPTGEAQDAAEREAAALDLI